jgi:hypothetical protein
MRLVEKSVYCRKRIGEVRFVCCKQGGVNFEGRETTLARRRHHTKKHAERELARKLLKLAQFILLYSGIAGWRGTKACSCGTT